MYDVGLALDTVDRRWSEGAERLQYFLAGSQETTVGRDEQQHIGATQMFRNPVDSRRSSQVEIHGKLIGRRRYELAIEVEHLARLPCLEEQRTGKHRRA